MKKSNSILIFLVLPIIFICGYTPYVSEPLNLYKCDEVAVKNPELIAIIDAFIERHGQNENNYVIEIEHKSHLDTISYELTYSIFNFDYDKNPPTMYFHRKNIVVLIYTGIEKEIQQSQEHIDCFNKAILFLERYTETPTDNPNISMINMPPTSNPPVWLIKMVNGKVVSNRVLN
jgi:hypothetical protein